MDPNDEREAPGRKLQALIEAHRSVSLGGYFRGIARASIAASILATGACADSSALKDAGTASPPLCEEGHWLPTAGLNPTGDPDYLAVYGGVCGGCAPPNMIIDASGVPCETAVDALTCQAAIDESAELWQRHLTTTLGDTVTRHQTKEELMAFLGSVDTEQEALLVAFMEGLDVRCDEPTYSGVRSVDDGYEVIGTAMTMDCAPIEYTRFIVHVAPDGTVTELSAEVYDVSSACIGRRPEGLVPAPRPRDAGAMGLHFASIARLEAASVFAFERLADELEALGASAELVADAREAAADEVRHADMMTAIARGFGAEPFVPRVEPPSSRDVFAVALENSVEGCVRETFGALVGTYQSMKATSPDVAEAMGIIAEDETRHASLSFRVAAFLDTLLDDGQRKRVADARRLAIAELRAEMSASPDVELAERVGLPHGSVALGFMDRLERELWAA